MTISTNICTVAEFKDSVFYEAHCACQADNHSQQLIVEFDPTVDDISVSIYSKVVTPMWTTWDSRYEYQEAMANLDFYAMAYYKAKLIMEHISAKVRFTLNIWFKGYIEVENQFIFRNENAIDDYVEAILSAKAKLKENKNGTNGTKRD